VFVEPVRWLFVIWGFTFFCSGLRKAGGNQHVRLFRWSSRMGSLFVIPDLMAQKRLLAHSERLAKSIEELAEQHPQKPIHLVAYSTGCYIALEACRRLPRPGVIRKVVLLAGTVSPRYKLEHLAGKTSGIHSFSSPVDLINGLGPLLFGSNDRRWGAASGMLGFRDAPEFVTQCAWRPSDMRFGYFGDHFTIVSPRFIAKRIAPILDDVLPTRTSLPQMHLARTAPDQAVSHRRRRI
jgi:pimeloyl-ACP methyl ester carboxylesterase